MPQWVRCAHGQCSYPCQSCTPAYQERFGSTDDEETEPAERAQLPLMEAKVEIFNRKQERMFTFTFESFPTLSDVKKKI